MKELDKYIQVCYHKNIMKTYEKIVSSLVGVGMLASCGGAQSTESIQRTADAALAEYVGEFGCELSNVSVEVVGEDEQQFVVSGPAGQEMYLDALTSEEGDIYLNKDLLKLEHVDHVTRHEAGHACEDRSTLHMFDEPLRTSDQSGVSIVGTQGLTMLFEGPDGSKASNPLVEEAAVDLVAQQASKTELDPEHDGYIAIRHVMGTLVEMRDLTSDDLVEMLYNDDLTGFLAIIYQKPAEEVTGDDFLAIATMFQIAQDSREVPSAQQVEEFLGIGTN
jgi:hypothetical protein